LKARKIRQALRQSIASDDAVILRAPGTLASCLQPYLQKAGHPYAVEVVGDPYDVFAPGAVKHPLRPVFRRLFSRHLRRQCNNAQACSYVTEKMLQLRYPPGKGSFSTHYSSIELPPEAIAKTARQLGPNKKRLSIIHVGTFSQLYKAPDVLIDAVARCVQKGMDLQLMMIGDGQLRSFLESRPASRKLGSRLSFLGRLPAGKAIRDELDKAGLFVLPSRQEGLPRATIEAMARGLPCIGSTVGGFPELLADEDLVPPGDIAALAQKIQEVLTDRDRMRHMSCRNLEKAKEYGSDVLQARRTAFYQYIKEAGKAA
jgi:glycosyltransferase involved in cell wall biosynthesis